jgi:hypothetical protein
LKSSDGLAAFLPLKKICVSKVVLTFTLGSKKRPAEDDKLLALYDDFKTRYMHADKKLNEMFVF